VAFYKRHSFPELHFVGDLVGSSTVLSLLAIRKDVSAWKKIDRSNG
jgi:hypothetical protein